MIEGAGSGSEQRVAPQREAGCQQRETRGSGRVGWDLGESREGRGDRWSHQQQSSTIEGEGGHEGERENRVGSHKSLEGR